MINLKPHELHHLQCREFNFRYSCESFFDGWYV